MSLGRLIGWLFGAVLMVIVGVLVIRWIPPLSKFVFGTSTPASGA